MIKDIYVSSAWFDKQKSDIILQHNIGSQISIELDALNNRREFTWYVDSDGTQYYDDPSIPDDPINEDPDPVIPEQTIYNITTTNTNNGSITVNKTNVVKGGSVIIRIIPNSGYKLLRLTVNNVDVTGLVSDNLYIYNNVQEHIIISASFLEIYTEPDPQDPIDPDPINPGEDPTNEPDVPQQLTQYTITTTASEGGKITASADTVDDGGSVTFTFTNYAGYVLGSVTVNGVEKDLNTDLQYRSKFEYTITDIHENINVTAIFVESESVRMRVMSSGDITYYYSYWSGDTKQSSYGQLLSETRYNYVQKNRPLIVSAQSMEDGKVIQNITVNGQIFYPQTPYDVSISYDCITTTDIDIVVHLLDIPANPHDESGNEWVPIRYLPQTQNITKIFVCTELTQDTSMDNTYILGTAVGSGAGFFLNDQDGLYWYNDGSYQYYYISNASETKTLIFDDGRTFAGKVINLKYITNITKQEFSLVKYYGM